MSHWHWLKFGVWRALHTCVILMSSCRVLQDSLRPSLLLFAFHLLSHLLLHSPDHLHLPCGGQEPCAREWGVRHCVREPSSHIRGWKKSSTLSRSCCQQRSVRRVAVTEHAVVLHACDNAPRPSTGHCAELSRGHRCRKCGASCFGEHQLVVGIRKGAMLQSLRRDGAGTGGWVFRARHLQVWPAVQRSHKP